MLERIQDLFFRAKRGKRISFADRWYDYKGKHPLVPEARARELKHLGFFAGTDLVYDFDRYGYDLYANNKEFYRLHPWNGPYSKLIDDKRFLPILMLSCKEYLPDLSISIVKGSVRFVTGLEEDQHSHKTLKNVLASALERYGDLFVKNTDLSGGRGAFNVSRETLDEAISKISGSESLIINNLLVNEEYAKHVNPASLNTFRVMVFKPRNGQLRLFKMVQRFGTKRTGSVDNVSQGGMACDVDIETGRLGKAFMTENLGERFSEPLGRRDVWYESHVDSGARLEGFVIPGWDEKLRQLAEILQCFSFLEFAGLDIAPTPDGLKVIEVNSLPALRLMQMTRPAFLDEEFKEFCLRKGYRF